MWIEETNSKLDSSSVLRVNVYNKFYQYTILLIAFPNTLSQELLRKSQQNGEMDTTLREKQLCVTN